MNLQNTQKVNKGDTTYRIFFLYMLENYSNVSGKHILENMTIIVQAIFILIF